MAHFKGEGNALAAHGRDAGSGGVGNADKAGRAKAKLDKPIGLMVDRQAQLLAIKLDGGGPLLAIQNGIGGLQIRC